ncbi:hypothetical protein LCGC14_0570820 [marine sediment metagenome]|uniref:Glycosyltransferase 2-like domain-containing protein n=1 Tax=marine sediment metagenome TaxID=412755 RepID=A0A0F9RJ84_9ZZZZ
MSKISIIVPVYNKSEFIKSCLESILAQTHKDFELIVINDGSTDNSGEIIEALAAIDDRLIVISQINAGVSAARNAGLEIASGDFIGFVDADDFIEKDMYALLLKNIYKQNADISICGVTRILPNTAEVLTGITKFEVYNQDQALTKFFGGKILLSSYEKLFRKDLFNDLRYRTSISLYEDALYNFKALMRAKKIVFDSSLKYKYVIRDNSESMSSFGPKYLDITFVSKEILNLTKVHLKNHLEEAKSFDFNTNMFVLNLIILNNDKIQYNLITSNLKKYNTFYKKARGIKNRYRKGYALFLISPKLYALVLKTYAFLIKSEHNQRKSK